MQATTHPSPEELTAYAQGKLPAALALAVEEHLLACDICAGARERQPEDSLLRCARQVDTVAEAAHPVVTPPAAVVTEAGTLPPPARMQLALELPDATESPDAVPPELA